MDIVVVGSISMDLVVPVDHNPLPGETILGSDYKLHHGGKGANQAVSAARLGGSVGMVCCIGKQKSLDLGTPLYNGLKREGVDVTYAFIENCPSGLALISVDKNGQNSIIVSPGSNSKLTYDKLTAEMFNNARVVLMQLEIPLETVKTAAELGKNKGATTILNAAPAIILAENDLENIDILVVNEVEAGMIIGNNNIKTHVDALSAAKKLQHLVPTVIITLGENGSVWVSKNSSGYKKAFKVIAKDTTAAGDAFLGALATIKPGAQASLPFLSEVELFLSKQ